VAVGLAGPLSNKIGRVRWLIILETISVFTGYLYTIKSTTILYICRAISGVVAGSNGALGIVAINEMFPSAIGGFSGLFLYIVLTSFILITSLFKPFLGTD
jgi:MFS family permease